MRKKLLIFISLILSVDLFSQPAVKIFAFERENLPGTKASGVTDENGNRVQKEASRKDYFVYLSFNKAYNISPSKVFIRGTSYEIKATKATTPVQYINRNIPSNPRKVVLVPATKNKVVQLEVAKPETENKKSGTIRKLIGRNDIVVEYLWKGKRYLVSIKKITKLEPVANE